MERHIVWVGDCLGDGGSIGDEFVVWDANLLFGTVDDDAEEFDDG